MANYINRVEVNGTEYEIVGPAGTHAISALTSSDLQSSGYWLSSHSSAMSTEFRWRRTGDNGNYKYDLVIIPENPDNFEYTEAS